MRKKSWELEDLFHCYEVIEDLEFRKIIEEVAEIAYAEFCQLPKDSFYCATNDDLKPLEEAA